MLLTYLQSTPTRAAHPPPSTRVTRVGGGGASDGRALPRMRARVERRPAFVYYTGLPWSKSWNGRDGGSQNMKP
jgi:hypothetical protein